MIVLAFLFAALATAQSVNLSNGTLTGGTCSSSNASSFLSVPYAQPPVGDLRFAPPQPFNGTYGQATNPAPNCIQFGTEFLESGISSEDCLYLDIWVPPQATNLPVKVWIYGGGNDAGSISDALYNGCNLATDSIVVSINYRLGPLGYLALQNAGIAGNMGIQDILLGLQWVQDNIEAFGGDKSKVLLFGQSAGASNTFVIGTLPQASTLINAGIAESGGGNTYPSSATQQTLGTKYASTLNCTDAACLRSKTTAELNSTFSSVGSAAFGAFVDGETIPAQPADVGVQVPFIFGSTPMEGTLLILAEFSSPTDITPIIYQEYLNVTFGSSASLIESAYPVSAFNNTPYPAFYALVNTITDANFKCPSYRGLNRAVQKGVPVWTYLWSLAPTCPWYSVIPAYALPIFGAAHTAEIPFVFNNIDNLPLPNGTCNFTIAEKQVSAEFVGFWTSMAANAEPGNGWPAYLTNGSMGLNVGNSSVAGVVDYSVCQLWDTVNAAVNNASTNGTTSSNATGIATSTPTGSASGSGASSTSTSGTSSSGAGPAMGISTRGAYTLLAAFVTLVFAALLSL